MKNTPETGASEQGEYISQQELFPVVFNPKWPLPNSMPAEALRRLSLVSLLANYSTSPSYAYDDHPALIAVQVSQQFKEVSPQKVKMVSYTSRFFESNLPQDFEIVGGVQ